MIIVTKKDKAYGKQTLLDISGYPMNFPNISVAKSFLKNIGFKDSEIKTFTFEEVSEEELNQEYHINEYEIKSK